MRARSIAMGGTDFMAKPFLVFEMSVKAMTLLMRKRLSAGRPTLAANASAIPTAAASVNIGEAVAA
jgi:DNA-binding response OmpR family regulator